MTIDTNSALTELLDREKIKAIAPRFARGLDRCDREIIESCFHPDGIDDHGFFRGSATEFCDWVMGQLTRFSATQHMIASQSIEQNGSRAVCESYFVAVHIIPNPEGDKELTVAGRYVDQVEKRDDEWKITLRTCIFDWNRMTDAAPAASPEGRYIGQQNRDDVSYALFNAIK